MVRGWRRLHNEELHNSYASPNIISMIKLKRMIWAKHVSRMGELRNTHNSSDGKLEGKRSLERSRRRWEDNIRMNLREIGREVVN
jgi:hypothetical protein